ncbi:MAG TPA: hypothetical protein VN201_05685 [Roseateles sp.]|nr:hypothetical protein [Roseateles sp.]
MVRALLAGTKTQTRRVVKPDGRYRLDLVAPADRGPSRCPYGQPGDRLWVREAWRVSKQHDPKPPRDIPARKCTVFFEVGGSIANQANGRWEEDPTYSANGADWVGKLRPSMFMPRWASRITLQITGVRVERLKDIGARDAIAEGAQPEFPDPVVSQACPEDYVTGYRTLWESINGAGSWALNPWVWVVEFKRIEV